MKPTLDLIAQKVGVHKSTVSRALNNSTKVNQETKEKIMAVAREIGYFDDTPHNSKIPIDSNIAFLSPPNFFTETDPFYPKVFRGLEQQAKKFNLHLIIRSADDDISNSLGPFIENKDIKGLIIPSNLPAKLNNNIIPDDIPVVGIDLDKQDNNFSTVYVDNIKGAMDMVKHLKQLGHKKIAFIGGSWHTSYRERFQGYSLGLQTCGLQYHSDYVFIKDDPEGKISGGTIDHGYYVMQNIINLENKPTAIMATNDMIAIGAIKAIHEANYKVPEDFSVTGFDNISWSSHVSPSLTTINIPKEKMGAMAIRILMGMFGPLNINESYKIVIPVDLIKRNSTSNPS